MKIAQYWFMTIFIPNPTYFLHEKVQNCTGFGSRGFLGSNKHMHSLLGWSLNDPDLNNSDESFKIRNV